MEIPPPPPKKKKNWDVLKCWAILANILLIPSFSWDVAPHHWVISTRRFETVWCSHFQEWKYLNGHFDTWRWRHQFCSDAVPRARRKETRNLLLWKAKTSSFICYKGLSSMELANANWNMRNTGDTMADGSREVFLAVSYRQLQMYHSHL